MDLSNHFLIAMPDMQDNFFAESVVYICSYSAEGCMGVIINKPSPLLLRQVLTAQQHELPVRPADEYILVGGPVQADRGFVLHTPVGNWLSSIAINDNLALTSSGDILNHLHDEQQVKQSLLFMGYTGWSAGQLERELADNSWLTVPANEQILFELPADQRYHAALALLNITPEQLIRTGGHA
ncbi:hypothetical protein A7P95_00885 [Eikenella longinqua]|uniref:UPF0301 protein A7P95_00885 n=1 Tax=Eikenella longinqua TaxID=1795827 RepID=A0A1A9S2U0_9NEIS|nr:YqgE/AlgH family protein [Eikenella longinqua]OAM31088.1 hypothetical protein A7P95_00885 [Eikenella longinqua]